MQTVPRSSFEVVIFDFDGTVADTHPLVYESFRQAFLRGLGVRFSDEEIHAMFGPPEEEIIQTRVPRELQDECVQTYLEIYRGRFHDLARPFKGVEVVLKELKKAGIKLGIYTAKGRKSLDISLEKLSMEKLFDVTVAGDEVGLPKPTARGINMVLEHLRAAKEKAFYVGDSKLDLLSSRMAGISFGFALWGAKESDKTSVLEELKLNTNGVYVLEKPQDILSVVLGPSASG